MTLLPRSAIGALCRRLAPVALLWVAQPAPGAPPARFTNLHSLAAAEGANPYAALIQASDGAFYGTANRGGDNDLGTVFKITADGTFARVFSFKFNTGTRPYAGLVDGGGGLFYGVASSNSSTDGTLFSLTSGGVLTTLHGFQSNADGASPEAALIRDSAGNLYGTASQGGSTGAGTIFRYSAAGVFTNLHNFTFNSMESALPYAPLVRDAAGNLYGTTVGNPDAGSTDYGAIFKLAPDGTITFLHRFNITDGTAPQAGLTLGPDGNYYGTASQGGAPNSRGVFFRITPAGVYTPLHSFTVLGNSPNDLTSGVALGPDGAFYGVTRGGGSADRGAIYRVTAEGDFATLHSFLGTADGSQPTATPIFGSDGALYGATFSGGSASQGAIYRLDIHDLLQFTSAAYSVSEAGGAATITVRRLNPGPDAASVQYATMDGGTATPGADYTAVSGTLNWAAGDAADKTFTVPVAADGEAEGDETVLLALGSAGGAAMVIAPDTATLTIINSGATPTPTPTPTVTPTVTPTPTPPPAPTATPTPTPPPAPTATPTPTPTATPTPAPTATPTPTPTPTPSTAAPVVTLLTPANGSIAPSGAAIDAVATVNDPDGVLTQLVFNLDGVPVATVSPGGPFTASLPAPAAGPHVLEVVVTDQLNRQSSATSSFTVTAPDLATVSLVAGAQRDLREGKTGKVRFERSGGNLAAPLEVFFHLSGTAKNGRDYHRTKTSGKLRQSIVIPAGETRATLKFYVARLLRRTVTLKFMLQDSASADYVRSATQKAKFRLIR